MIGDDEIAIVSQKDENRIKPTPIGKRMGLILDDVNASVPLCTSFQLIRSSLHHRQFIENIVCKLSSL
jgi:hypothetical protein